MRQARTSGVWLAAAVMAASGAVVASAQEPVSEAPAAVELSGYDHMQGALRKLGRGVANLVTCPGEIIRVFDQVGRRDGYVAASTVGLLQGVARTVLRAGAGVWEVATFPFKNNAQGYGPIIRPEFVFAHGGWTE